MFLALALGLLTSLAIVSCGSSSNDNLLPGDTAKQIIANLESVQQIADSGNCSDAVTAAEEVKQQIDDLPSTVDPKLRNNLDEGAQRLINVLNQPGACIDATGSTDTSTTDTSTTDTSATDTSTTTKTKPDKTTKQPTTPTTTSTPTTPTTTTPTNPTTPTTPGGGSGTGGIGSGGKSGGGQSPPAVQPRSEGWAG